MKLNPILLSASSLTLGVIGFFVGKSQQAPSSKSDLSLTSLMSSSARNRPSNAAQSGSESSTNWSNASERDAKISAVFAIADPIARQRALLSLIDRLAPEDFAAAIELARKGEQVSPDEMRILLSAWAGIDPLSAITFADEKLKRGGAKDTVLSAWAAKDPAGAIAWAKANFQGEGANPYFSAIIKSLGAIDPNKALSLIAEMPYSGERGRALDSLIPHLTKFGSDEAMTWIGKITDEKLRNGAKDRVLDRLAANGEAEKVLNWLDKNQGSPEQISNVLGSLYEQNPTLAKSRYEQLPAGEIRTDALREMVESTCRNDPKKALDLAQSYSTDVDISVARAGAWNSFRSDPVTAMNFAELIPDEASKIRMQSRGFGFWQRDDSAAANAWLATQSPEKQKLIQENPHIGVGR